MIYAMDGTALTDAFDIDGEQLNVAFDIEGNDVYHSWFDEITVEKNRDPSTSTAYYVVTIPQTRPNGTKQYPFVFAPNGADGGTMSTLTMMKNYHFYLGMNGGYFDAFQTGSLKPYGITIQNSVLIREATEQYFLTNYTLTIDGDGKLGYADTMQSGVTAQDVLDSGAVSSLLGLVPLVVNGQPSGVSSTQWTSTEKLQRQIIGQYSNGDYVVITCEGKDFDSSPGFTITEVQNLCLSMNLDFAMAVDGGGSTETVIGNEQINTIYENTTGRIVPTFIVFNGTDTFGVPR